MRLDWDVVYMKKEKIRADVLDMILDRMDEELFDVSDERYDKLVSLMYDDVANGISVSLNNYLDRIASECVDVL